MTVDFTVDVWEFDPWTRESIKRAIIDQGRKQDVKVYITTHNREFQVKLTGEHGIAEAYEAAIRCWFADHGIFC